MPPLWAGEHNSGGQFCWILGAVGRQPPPANPFSKPLIKRRESAQFRENLRLGRPPRVCAPTHAPIFRAMDLACERPTQFPLVHCKHLSHEFDCSICLPERVAEVRKGLRRTKNTWKDFIPQTLVHHQLWSQMVSNQRSQPIIDTSVARLAAEWAFFCVR